MLRLLLFALIPFKIWMLVDAIRRRADTYWLWIIVGVPGGSLLYFLLVRMRDYDAQQIQQRLLASVKRPESIDTLQFRYEQTPSIAARLALAQALGDAGRWEEARGHFQGVLDQRREEPDALFGLGVCSLELGDATAAAETLETLEGIQGSYRDFALYPELAAAYETLGEPARALDLLRDLVRREPRLRHSVLLAERLIRAGEAEEAREQLQRSLREHEEAPHYVKRNNRVWARRASTLLHTATASRSSGDGLRAN